MAKITITALQAQFNAEQALVAAAVKELALRAESQHRQLGAAFARIDALEKALAAKPAAADSRPRQSGWRPSYIAAVEAAGRKHPGKPLKVVGGAVYAQIGGNWTAV